MHWKSSPSPLLFQLNQIWGLEIFLLGAEFTCVYSHEHGSKAAQFGEIRAALNTSVKYDTFQ